MRISLIVAASANGVIGVRGELPWHLPNDFRYFKQQTINKPVVMGRVTWESIGKPLPDRHNIVMTQNEDYRIAEGTVVRSPAAAMEAAANEEELMVIGGAQIYELFRDKADRILMTRVNIELEGDAHFREPNAERWELTSSDPFKADERHAFDYDFRVYERR